MKKKKKQPKTLHRKIVFVVVASSTIILVLTNAFQKPLYTKTQKVQILSLSTSDTPENRQVILSSLLHKQQLQKPLTSREKSLLAFTRNPYSNFNETTNLIAKGIQTATQDSPKLLHPYLQEKETQLQLNSFINGEPSTNSNQLLQKILENKTLEGSEDQIQIVGKGTITLNGSLPQMPGSLVVIEIISNQSQQLTTTADEKGNWKISSSKPLEEGFYNIRGTYINPNNNTVIAQTPNQIVFASAEPESIKNKAELISKKRKEEIKKVAVKTTKKETIKPQIKQLALYAMPITKTVNVKEGENTISQLFIQGSNIPTPSPLEIKGTYTLANGEPSHQITINHIYTRDAYIDIPFFASPNTEDGRYTLKLVTELGNISSSTTVSFSIKKDFLASTLKIEQEESSNTNTSKKQSSIWEKPKNILSAIHKKTTYFLTANLSSAATTQEEELYKNQIEKELGLTLGTTNNKETQQTQQIIQQQEEWRETKEQNTNTKQETKNIEKINGITGEIERVMNISEIQSKTENSEIITTTSLQMEQQISNLLNIQDIQIEKQSTTSANLLDEITNAQKEHIELNIDNTGIIGYKLDVVVLNTNSQEQDTEKKPPISLETNLIKVNRQNSYGYNYPKSVNLNTQNNIFNLSSEPETKKRESFLPKEYFQAEDSLQLSLTKSRKRKKKQYLTFQQHYKSIPIYNGEIRATTNTQGEILSLSSDIHNQIIIENENIMPVEKAISSLTQQMNWEESQDILHNLQLFIYPQVKETKEVNEIIQQAEIHINWGEKTNDQINNTFAFTNANSSTSLHKYLFVYEASITTSNPFGRWKILLNAVTGEILQTENEVHLSHSWIELRGYKKTEKGDEKWIPYPNTPLLYNDTTTHTDKNGKALLFKPKKQQPLFQNPFFNLTIDTEPTPPIGKIETLEIIHFNQKGYLENPEVLSIYSDTLRDIQHPAEKGIRITKIPKMYPNEYQSAFYYLNKAFEILEKEYHHEPQIQVWAHVNAVASKQLFNGCTSFFDKKLQALHFAEPGCGYDNHSFSPDIIYHELTHFIIQDIAPIPYITGTEGAALQEAVADYFAKSWQGNDPVFGKNYTNETRNLQNTLTMNNFTGSSHADSLILSGALWNLRTEIGREKTDELVYNALYAGHKTFEDFLFQLIIEDDDDELLYNGTPHLEAILSEFHTREIGPSFEEFSNTYLDINNSEEIKRALRYDALFSNQQPNTESDDQQYLFYQSSPFIEATLSLTEWDLGELSPTVSTSSALTITVNTNADKGWTIKAKSTGDGTTPGLVHTEGNGIIIESAESTGVINSGDPAFGLYAENAGSGVTIHEGFDNDGTQDDAILTSYQTVASTSALQSGDRTVDIKSNAVIDSIDIAGSYTDTVEFIIFANWE